MADSMSSSSKTPISVASACTWFRTLQDALCTAFESLDSGARFIEDRWERDGGGGGISRVLSGGAVFEKAGINSSEVYGELDPAFAGGLPGRGTAFHAGGVSMVLHPQSPMVPAFHANVRMISRGDALWVGGGADLTPCYPKVPDAVHFHRTWKQACDSFDPVWYARFKTWCDRYFYLPHRGEMRGVGGLFFDYVGIAAPNIPERARQQSPLALPTAVPIERAWSFVQLIGQKILEAYVPIVESRRAEPFGEKEREFLLYRRGRYAEFNLLYDRGTQFGLKTGGRTESILMSMPPLVRWTYNFEPAAGSREAALQEFLRPRDWAAGGS